MTSSPTWEANDGSAGVDGSPFHKTKHPKWGVHCPSWENAKRAGSEGWVGGGVVSQTARLLMQRGSDWPLLAPSLSLAVY